VSVADAAGHDWLGAPALKLLYIVYTKAGDLLLCPHVISDWLNQVK